MKGKMVNANTMTDMSLVNVKAQAKTAALVQKIGKVKRKVKVTLSKPSQRYLSKLIDELKKNMVAYEKQMPNLFSYFDYLKKQVDVPKGKKQPKTKEFLVSYEELDFLKLQLKETIKGIDNLKKNLKWYNVLKKALYSMLRKQNELLLQELS